MKTAFIAVLSLLLGAVTAQPSGPPARALQGSWVFSDPGGRPICLTFFSDQTYQVDFNHDSTIEVRGVYEVNADQVSVRDTWGTYMCPEDMPGIYRFTAGPEWLSLEVLQDACNPQSVARKEVVQLRRVPPEGNLSQR
jgi:hypothetical protein